jgi:hypothetical protein
MDSLRGRQYEALAIPYIRPDAPIIVIIGVSTLRDFVE